MAVVDCRNLHQPSSSSSSDFEFTVSVSPTTGRPSSSQLCPADELFYKGQLLPLHLSPRISMVRTLLLASSSSTSSDSTGTTASRDSNGSSSSSSFSAADLNNLLLPSVSAECDSSRPSSVTDDEFVKVVSSNKRLSSSSAAGVPIKYLSTFATRFSSVFLHRGGSKKDSSAEISELVDSSLHQQCSKRSANSPLAKEVIKKCVKKVKPLYEKLSSLQQIKNNSSNNYSNSVQQQQQKKKTFSFSIRREREASGSCILPAIITSRPRKKTTDELEEQPQCFSGSTKGSSNNYSNSFSGNLKYPRRKRAAASCPSSMRSSPSHSGLLRVGGKLPETTTSSMEELHSAIQGAIAHCKSSMVIQTNQQQQLIKSCSSVKDDG